MTNNGINSLLNQGMLSQMKALEGMAKAQPVEVSLEAKEVDNGQSFANMMKSAIDSVNQTQQQAAGLSQSFETGDKNIDLAEVMIAIQKSRLSFTALTEVRNKLLTAYQDVMNMPV